jgi:predicted O-methyltransferase YrrM
MKIKQMIKRVLPLSWQKSLLSLMHPCKRKIAQFERRLFEAMGYKVAQKSDYFSPLPTLSALERKEQRWNRPSAMAGVRCDVDLFKRRLGELIKKYADELSALPSYDEIFLMGFGVGYTEFDAQLLYMMIRETKPRRYLEVGSGVSTYYCSLAALQNAKEGHPLTIRCIEPYPFEKLRLMPGIDIVQSEVQDIEAEVFTQLEENDVFFIDSSHVLTIDGDIPFLFLEILPRLRKGVLIHVHDVPFPYNIPYPAEHWVLCRDDDSPYWPMFWNEAMFLQAFMAYNTAFEIEMSTPMIRHFDESFLVANVPSYKPVKQQPNTFSSIWIRKVG